jgi:hypothetical protein
MIELNEYYEEISYSSEEINETLIKKFCKKVDLETLIFCSEHGYKFFKHKITDKLYGKLQFLFVNDNNSLVMVELIPLTPEYIILDLKTGINVNFQHSNLFKNVDILFEITSDRCERPIFTAQISGKNQQISFNQEFPAWLNQDRLKQILASQNSFQMNEKEAISILKEDPHLFSCASESLKKNCNIILKIIESGSPMNSAINPGSYLLAILNFVDSELLTNFDFVCNLVNIDADSLGYCNKRFQLDRGRILEMLRRTLNPYVIKHVDKKYRKDREIMMEVLAMDGVLLEYADLELKMDREILETAYNSNEDAIEYIPENMRIIFEKE